MANPTMARRPVPMSTNVSGSGVTLAVVRNSWVPPPLARPAAPTSVTTVQREKSKLCAPPPLYHVLAREIQYASVVLTAALVPPCGYPGLRRFHMAVWMPPH
jgi:hypothetical protein